MDTVWRPTNRGCARSLFDVHLVKNVSYSLSKKTFRQCAGPAGRDVKLDLQRHKRYSRWHLPDVLKGPNPYLADKIDGLITGLCLFLDLAGNII